MECNHQATIARNHSSTMIRNHRLPPSARMVAVLRVFLLAVLFVGAVTEQLEKLDLEPLDQTAVAGSTVILPCRILNLKNDAQVQWTKDGFGLGIPRNLPGFPRYFMTGSDEENDYSLRIDNVKLMDDGDYECQVLSGRNHKVRSRTAKLTVFVPPAVPYIKPKRKVRAMAGKPVTITCYSTGGRPEPEIMWYDTKGSLIQGDHNISLSMMEDNKRMIGESKLTFIPTREQDGKFISCLTLNPAMSTPLSTKVELEVRYAPAVDLSVSPRHITEGTEVTVKCDTLANPGNVTFRWSKDNEPLNVSSNTRVLPLGILSRQDDGSSISCEASNDIGSNETTIVLDVKYPAHFINTPSSISAHEGDNVSLQCRIQGNPKPRVVWTHHATGEVVGEGDELRLEANSVTAGQYTCSAVSRGSEPLAAELSLWLKGPPIISALKAVSVHDGRKAVLQCHIVSVPHPESTLWLKDGNIIAQDDERISIKEEQKPDGMTSRLIFEYTNREDFNSYSCSAKNKYGKATRQMILKKAFPLIGWVGVAVCSAILVFIVIFALCCMTRKYKEKTAEKSACVLNSEGGNNHSSDATMENGIENGVADSFPTTMVPDNLSTGKDSETKDCGRTVSSMSVEDRDSVAAWESDRESFPRHSLELHHLAQLHTPKNAREKQPPITALHRRLSETTFLGPDDDHLPPAYFQGDAYPSLAEGTHIRYELASCPTSSDPASSLTSSQSPPSFSLTQNGYTSPHISYYKMQPNGQAGQVTSPTTNNKNSVHIQPLSAYRDYEGMDMSTLKLIRNGLMADLKTTKENIEKNIPTGASQCSYILPPRTALKPGTLV